MMFATGLCSAIAIKLSSSVDDVVWLAPFLTSNIGYGERVQNAIVYIGVCLIQTVVAMAIAYSGDAAVALVTNKRQDSWSSQKILTVTAGVLLAIYTVKLAYEFITESDEEGEEEEDSTSESEKSHLAADMELGEVEKDEDCSFSKESEQRNLPTLLATEPEHVKGSKCLLEDDKCWAGDKHDGNLPKLLSACQRQLSKQSEETDVSQSCKGAKGKKNSQALFVIAFIGSIDDLTLFVPMLVGKGFNWLQLISGAIVAASAIVMICLFIGLCKPVANFLSSIPLALIVAVFASSLLVKGFTMD
jgi:hypothetical protein